MNRCAGWLAAVVVGAVVAGCGGSGPSQSADENVKQQSAAKLDAMKRLADAIERKDQQQVLGLVEALVSTNMDVKGNPTAAKELVDVYQKRVKGKLPAEQATQVKAVVDQIEKELKG